MEKEALEHFERIVNSFTEKDSFFRLGEPILTYYKIAIEAIKKQIQQNNL